MSLKPKGIYPLDTKLVKRIMALMSTKELGDIVMPLIPKKSAIKEAKKAATKPVDVYCLSTGNIIAAYCLPPDEAVVCAFYQFGLKDFNTCNYKYNAESTKHGYVRGDYYCPITRGKQ
jgi:hypothetical protein